MYKGYIEICPDEKDLTEFYQHPENNIFECLVNEYIVIKDIDGNIVDKMKWNGQKYERVAYKIINNDYMGKIKPRNPQQELAFDMLQDKGTTIKVLSGKFGSGKSFLMISMALQLIKEGKFDKLIWVRNNQEVKDTKALGALPGETFDKLLPFAMVLADHVGGKDGLEYLIK